MNCCFVLPPCYETFDDLKVSGTIHANALKHCVTLNEPDFNLLSSSSLGPCPIFTAFDGGNLNKSSYKATLVLPPHCRSTALMLSAIEIAG